MTALPLGEWLFTRGARSVRFVRNESAKGCRLHVYGPGNDVATHDFANVTECMKRQAEIEQSLLAAAYQITRSPADRRNGQGKWDGPDHRRAAS
jgi:hypothetical protein